MRLFHKRSREYCLHLLVKKNNKKKTKPQQKNPTTVLEKTNIILIFKYRSVKINVAFCVSLFKSELHF